MASRPTTCPAGVSGGERAMKSRSWPWQAVTMSTSNHFRRSSASSGCRSSPRAPVLGMDIQDSIADRVWYLWTRHCASLAVGSPGSVRSNHINGSLQFGGSRSAAETASIAVGVSCAVSETWDSETVNNSPPFHCSPIGNLSNRLTTMNTSGPVRHATRRTTWLREISMS